MTEDAIVSRARALAGALAESGFTRLRVSDTGAEVEVRRAARAAPAQPQAPVARATDQTDRVPALRGDVVASDVVGIVRHLRPATVEGQQLDGDRELAYVETLGIRNPVRSRGAGRISAVFVTEGQPVEYGQPLFTVER